MQLSGMANKKRKAEPHFFLRSLPFPIKHLAHQA